MCDKFDWSEKRVATIAHLCTVFSLDESIVDRVQNMIKEIIQENFWIIGENWTLIIRPWLEKICNIELMVFYPNIQEIIIPASVIEIQKGAFEWLKQLKKVTFQWDAISVIPEDCFKNCCSLESIVLPRRVTVVWVSAFQWCTALTDVVLWENLEEIWLNSFWNCKKLEHISFPYNFQKIGIQAFSGSGLRSLIIPRTVTEIWSQAFKNCENLGHVILKNLDQWIAIWQNAFEGCPLAIQGDN